VPLMQPKERFVLETEKWRDQDQEDRSWDQLLCNVMEVQEDGTRKKIGQFKRNYSCLYNTWEPFEQNGKFFALCSREYTATAVMALPECEIIAEETPHGFGFCPTGFFVPTEMKGYIDDDKPKPLPEEWKGKFGFVCGCIWGDDTNWKIEFLDLSEITQGKITRDNRFGYVELLGESDSLSKFVFVGDETDGERLVINIIHETYWTGSLKWEAGAKEEKAEPIDLNKMADEMTNCVIEDIEYRMKKAKKVVPDELKGDTFRKDVRDTMISYLGRINMPNE
jgi:hypothetical protein